MSAVTEWFKRNNAEAKDWFMEEPSEWVIETKNGDLVLDETLGCVFVYSGLGQGMDYGFSLFGPPESLLDALLEQGNKEVAKP